MILPLIETPADLRSLNESELEQLSEEIRNFIVETVTTTGGHLGSNLGVVELTLALHRVFDSPRGRFEVLSLLRNPVWAKPDWAFVEDGQPIPTNPADRLETGSLGEYALYFGNGFMIHGTLYERLLGRAVSHGCIRVGRDDLRKVWANARLGMHIYIY